MITALVLSISSQNNKLVSHLMVIYYLKCGIAVRLWQYNAAVV